MINHFVRCQHARRGCPLKLLPTERNRPKEGKGLHGIIVLRRQHHAPLTGLQLPPERGNACGR